MKRIIFTLLHANGSYMLSRNFRLQRVGDIGWVLTNYRISKVSLGIDELMILDVSRDFADRERFRAEVRTLADECFVPVTVGGRIGSMDEAAALFEAGADKLLFNRAVHEEPALCTEVAARFGSQSLVAGIDVSRAPLESGNPRAQWMVEPVQLERLVGRAVELGAGEILVQSIDRDGTGAGLDLQLADHALAVRAPLILMGGVGHAAHIIEGLRHPAVDAVATANLLNFVGDALVRARRESLDNGLELAVWNNGDFEGLRGAFAHTESRDRSRLV